MIIDTTQNCDEEEITDEGIMIIAQDKNGNEVIVPYRDLEWRSVNEDGDNHDLPELLTLKEIKDQLFSRDFQPTFYAWDEGGLSGIIYQYRTDIGYWVMHGETKGYA